MGAFVVTKRFDGFFKFVFTSRKGKPIFTSSKFILKTDCENGIVVVKTAIKNNAFVSFKGNSGKYFFKIVEDDRILAVSRKFTTELRLQKGLDEIVRFSDTAETLDFSEADFIFSETDS